MEAGEQLYRAGLSVESKATEIAENAVLYRHAAFSAVRCEEIVDGLLILERGKTRLLAEALRLRIPRPTDVPDEVWSAFENAGEAIRAAQAESVVSVNEEERDPVQTYAAREHAVRAANSILSTAIERVRSHASNFIRPIELSTIHP